MYLHFSCQLYNFVRCTIIYNDCTHDVSSKLASDTLRMYLVGRCWGTRGKKSQAIGCWSESRVAWELKA